MQVRITLKTPDALDDAIERAAEDEIGGASDDESSQEPFEELVAKTKKLAERWFRYGELVSLVLDTEDETCTVERVE